jgi:glycosyltransferase involved in cell wall biosynthesis
MKESLINKVKQENIANVLFWDVPDGKVPEIQSNADVLMLPMKKGSGLSSIPSKLPAYMFTQKPIIACVDNGSDTGNCILEAGCGYVIEPENIQALANQMNTIISLNNAELNKMGENGFNYAIKHLSKTENLKRLSAIFNK